MQVILATVAGWPPLVVYGIMGIAVGLIGGLIAYPFHRAGFKYSKLIPLALIVATGPMMPEFIAPRLAEAQINASLPRKLDDYTTLEAARIADKELTYFFAVSGDVPADFDVTVIKTDSLSSFCSTFQSSFSSGFYKSVVYDYRLAGGSKQFSVTPEDCR